ncbi:unnamed protein product [Arctogadus glacialis]
MVFTVLGTASTQTGVQHHGEHWCTQARMLEEMRFIQDTILRDSEETNGRRWPHADTERRALKTPGSQS